MGRLCQQLEAARADLVLEVAAGVHVAGPAGLQALLGDLGELSHYLSDRARHTYDLAQRFVENSQRNSATRVYDERQATMLEYQHYIWVEIAGLLTAVLIVGLLAETAAVAATLRAPLVAALRRE